MKKWEILHVQSSKYKVQKETDENIIKTLLQNRGIHTGKEIDKFLHPQIKSIFESDWGIDPKEVQKAIKRIEKAICTKETVTVYTDYDTDGLTSGAVMWETLYSLGVKALPYVPRRIEEGYGLSETGIDNIIRIQNPTLIITVDHGITACAEVEYARKKGIETIIIDHHLKPEKLPICAAVVHTTQMCACGVTWNFCDALLKKLGTKVVKTNTDMTVKSDPAVKKLNIMAMLELVAMGTISDLIPLTGHNRNLVYFGLRELNKTTRVGLKTLIEDSALKSGDIGVYEVGHIISPRINAMGRLSHGLESLRLLCTNDQGRAMELSRKLTLTNRQRQELTQVSSDRAIREVKKLKESKIIISAHKSYSQGVIGLIAGKLVEEFYRPSIAISVGEVFSKASARSVNGFNIVGALQEAGDLIEEVGGHPMAAGFTIRTENIEKFISRMAEIGAKSLQDELLVRRLKIDTVITLDLISRRLYHKIKELSPFGVGNNEPVFASLNVEATGGRIIGGDLKHLKLSLRQGNGGNIFSAIGFGMANLYQRIHEKRFIDIAYTVDLNTWNGCENLQLKLKDVRFPD